MITLPPTSTNQYSINTEDPVSFIPNDIVTDIFGNIQFYVQEMNIFKSFQHRYKLKTFENIQFYVQEMRMYFE